MGFTISSSQYMEYLSLVADKIANEKDYISDLDAATGDGDHWANLNLGFSRLTALIDEFSALPIAQCFRKIGMTMMTVVGGSSGVLYGGAYMAAAKTLPDPVMSETQLSTALETMVNDMMERGQSEPGQKTMIDCLYPAAQAYKTALANGLSDGEALNALKEAAVKGAESTRDMVAMRGRACYQPNKGVGHLDPGAVTMSYQIVCLADYIRSHVIKM